MEMAKQAKGTERLGERHKAVLATEAKPAPTAKGALVRSARMSTAGTLKDLTAHHAISLSLADFAVSLFFRLVGT